MKGDSKKLAGLLPSYPRTPHLPYKPNPAPGDVLTPDDEQQAVLMTILGSETQVIEEKVDGANCAVMLDGGDFIVRNRDHVLKKGYVKKETPAKLQFRPIWNWVHDHRKLFEAANRAYGRPVGVYGEWLWALHGIVYDKLPSYFVAFDLYDPEARQWVAPEVARPVLQAAGFTCAPLLHKGRMDDFDLLDQLSQGKSDFGTGQREGIYIKDSYGSPFVKFRYKMIREGYTQGALWNPEKLTRQKLT
jgi:atypical dual specificity phosphatase